MAPPNVQDHRIDVCLSPINPLSVESVCTTSPSVERLCSLSLTHMTPSSLARARFPLTVVGACLAQPKLSPSTARPPPRWQHPDSLAHGLRSTRPGRPFSLPRSIRQLAPLRAWQLALSQRLASLDPGTLAMPRTLLLPLICYCLSI
jgi:hypothetical protein